MYVTYEGKNIPLSAVPYEFIMGLLKKDLSDREVYEIEEELAYRARRASK